MTDKYKIEIILFVIIGIALIGIILIGWYFWNVYINPNINNINNCNSDSDCVVVRSGACGHASAININYLDIWNKHLKLEYERVRNEQILCAPTLPSDYFKAECVNNKCIATRIK